MQQDFNIVWKYTEHKFSNFFECGEHFFRLGQRDILDSTTGSSDVAYEVIQLLVNNAKLDAQVKGLSQTIIHQMEEISRLKSLTTPQVIVADD